VLTDQGADAPTLAAASAELVREEEHVRRREQDLAAAQEVENNAKAALEQCRLANIDKSDADPTP
jgi:hypothetical protein